MTNNKPYLEKYHGKGSRHTCPACKQKQTFTYYIDPNTGEAINHTVGRCNREIKCGYHYTPREYFKDNPNKGSAIKGSAKSSDKMRGVNGNLIGNGNQKICLERSQKKKSISKIDYIPSAYVKNSISVNSNFIRYLCNYFTKEDIERAISNYWLGATKNGSIIYWQIDVKGNVRTGKIMQYDPATGKRVKSRTGINWVHCLLKKRSPFYANYNLCQCYFGEHLLAKYPEKPVAIVEGEKTAVISSMIYTDFNWLAAGNLHGLTIEKSAVLKNRYVVLYPDAGCLEKWRKKITQIKREIPCKADVSDLVENHANDEQLENGYDLADYIIDNTKSTTLQKMIEINPALQTLIDEFGLEEVK